MKELAGAHLQVFQDDGRWVTVQPEATWADLTGPEAWLPLAMAQHVSLYIAYYSHFCHSKLLIVAVATFAPRKGPSS